MQSRLSLKGRALQLLAQRDQSRVELRRKLVRHAASEQRASGLVDAEPDIQDAEVEAVLDWLETHGYLSAERFAESRIHAREARFGNLRIRSELAQHGVSPSPAAALELADTELQRAASVRERRFPQLPLEPSQRAAQSRFLAARGFSADVIHRLMRQLRGAAKETREMDPREPA